MTISDAHVPSARAGQRFLSEMWLAHLRVCVCVSVCRRGEGGDNAYTGLKKKKSLKGH